SWTLGPSPLCGDHTAVRVSAAHGLGPSPLHGDLVDCPRTGVVMWGPPPLRGDHQMWDGLL
ncbi:hypothetical protein, partial [Streptomyces monomycini]|uniref:hypothetical protein n=1 Tax=Streptomyces monomycini TaxID=371720 RepID=UPI001AD80EC3